MSDPVSPMSVPGCGCAGCRYYKTPHPLTRDGVEIHLRWVAKAPERRKRKIIAGLKAGGIIATVLFLPGAGIYLGFTGRGRYVELAGAAVIGLALMGGTLALLYLWWKNMFEFFERKAGKDDD